MGNNSGLLIGITLVGGIQTCTKKISEEEHWYQEDTELIRILHSIIIYNYVFCNNN